MSTVAPSAPAPTIAADASSTGAKGESADPSAFAAEFESAVTQLATATAAPTTQTAASPPTEALPTATPPAAELPASAPAATPPAAELPSLPAAPAPTIPEMTDVAPPVAPSAPVVPAPAAPISVTSHLAAGAPAAGEPDEADETIPADGAAEGAIIDAPALALPVVLPVPVDPSVASAARGEAATAAAPAVAAVRAPSAGGTDALTGAPAVAVTDTAPAPAPVTAAPVPAAAAAPLQPLAEVATVAAPARAQAPDLVGQLSRPLQGLRSFGDGTHVISISVTPDNLGPVAVRAHVTGDTIRIELVAPTDQARAAIKDILPDLRRDLSGSGGQATLDLSSGNQPSGREGAAQGEQRHGRVGDSVAPAPTPGIRPTTTRSDAGLDVLA